MKLKNKAIVFLIILVTVISAQSFTTNKQDDEDKPKNLKFCRWIFLRMNFIISCAIIQGH
jgi:hypothetical protein